MADGKAELLPHHVSRVRRDGIEHPQQQRQTFARKLDALPRTIRRNLFQRVEHLHARGYDSVVLDSFVVVARLLQVKMELAPELAQRWRSPRPVDRGQRPSKGIDETLTVRPQPLQKPELSLDALVRPQRG